MVADTWLVKMRNQVSNNIKNSLFIHQTSSKNKTPSTKIPKKSIGILSFEVANAMSKLVNLYKSVTDQEIAKLKNEIIKSEGIKKLVSCDESYLLELAFVERLDDLNRVADVVSRLGKKCTEPALLGFEHVYDDIKNGKIEVSELSFLVKDMEGMIKRIERYVGATASLYSELEVLNELEQNTKKFHLNQNVESRRAFEQKLVWHKQDVRHLKDVSLWNQSYDKVVELLARTVCTLYDRICVIFGNNAGLKRDISDERIKNQHCGKQMRREMEFLQHQDGLFPCGPSPGRIFMECFSLSTSASTIHDEVDDVSVNNSHVSNPSRTISGFKTRLVAYATPTTIGGSALALHYANVIIIIEKLLRYPHLVGDEARSDLYQMLPTSLRKLLRINLKSNFQDYAIYDAPLAHDWKETLDVILKWLAPLAHNMIRWQSERNFEQQQIVNRTNVLLLHTLYFADRDNTEAAICQLLIGLNYICRYEHQKNALLDCVSSFDFGDCMAWQLHCQSSGLS